MPEKRQQSLPVLGSSTTRQTCSLHPSMAHRQLHLHSRTPGLCLFARSLAAETAGLREETGASLPLSTLDNPADALQQLLHISCICIMVSLQKDGMQNVHVGIEAHQMQTIFVAASNI